MTNFNLQIKLTYMTRYERTPEIVVNWTNRSESLMHAYGLTLSKISDNKEIVITARHNDDILVEGKYNKKARVNKNIIRLTVHDDKPNVAIRIVMSQALVMIKFNQLLGLINEEDCFSGYQNYYYEFVNSTQSSLYDSNPQAFA